MIGQTGRPRQIRGDASSDSSVRRGRATRVSLERALELVRHLTERDREIACRLYDQQPLTQRQRLPPLRTPPLRPLRQGLHRHVSERQRWPLPLRWGGDRPPQPVLRLHGPPKYGPKACDGERLPRENLEAAVLRQLAPVYRDEQLIADALAKATAEAERGLPELKQRLASISAEITRAEQALERYYEAFEQGKLSPERCEQRLSRLQSRLRDLHAQEAELSLPPPHKATPAPTAADLAAVADELERVIAEAEPQRAKALLRPLIDELRVNGRAEILPTYRLVTPAVCAISGKSGANGTRTRDLLAASQTLSQLSYGPARTEASLAQTAAASTSTEGTSPQRSSSR